MDTDTNTRPEGKVIYHEFTNPGDRHTLYDDLAQEYLIIECGIVVWGRFDDGQWEANAGYRSLIKKLVDRITTLESELP